MHIQGKVYGKLSTPPTTASRVELTISYSLCFKLKFLLCQELQCAMPPIEEHTFTHSDNKTTFYHAGGPKDGPLLIFIHGWPAIGKLWKRHILVFSSLGFRVVAPDMPGMHCDRNSFNASARLTSVKGMESPRLRRTRKTIRRRISTSPWLRCSNNKAGTKPFG